MVPPRVLVTLRLRKSGKGSTSSVERTTTSRLGSGAGLLHRPGDLQLGAARRRHCVGRGAARRGEAAAPAKCARCLLKLTQRGRASAVRAAAPLSISGPRRYGARLLPPQPPARHWPLALLVVRGSSHPTRTLASGVKQQQCGPRQQSAAARPTEPSHARRGYLCRSAILHPSGRALVSATSASPTSPARTIAFVTHVRAQLTCALATFRSPGGQAADLSVGPSCRSGRGDSA